MMPGDTAAVLAPTFRFKRNNRTVSRPDARHAQGVERCIRREKCVALGNGLPGEQPVERIPVWQGQGAGG